MRGIFSGYELNVPLPDISKWNTTNLISKSEMFPDYI